MSLYPDADTAARATARTKVARKARDGDPPHAHFAKADLEWAFEGHDDQLAELEQVAAKVRSDRLEQEQRREVSRELNSLTEQILQEWEREEQRERRAKAHAEARRRLGLDG